MTMHPDIGVGSFVSAYYHVPKPGLSNIGLARYVSLMPRTLSMIQGRKLVFYYEDDFVGELVSRMCHELGIAVELVHLPLSNLPLASFADELADRASMPAMNLVRAWGSKEKGVAHAKGLMKSGGYRGNLAIWLSKIALVNDTVDRGTSGVSGPIAWVDIGISKKSYTRSNWDFAQVPVQEGMISHYGSSMTCEGQRLPLNASFLAGYPVAWRRLNALFLSELEKTFNETYPHDEETVLARVVRREPELFLKVGDPDPARFSRIRYLLRRLSSG